MQPVVVGADGGEEWTAGSTGLLVQADVSASNIDTTNIALKGQAPITKCPAVGVGEAWAWRWVSQSVHLGDDGGAGVETEENPY